MSLHECESGRGWLLSGCSCHWTTDSTDVCLGHMMPRIWSASRSPPKAHFSTAHAGHHPPKKAEAVARDRSRRRPGQRNTRLQPFQPAGSAATGIILVAVPADWPGTCMRQTAGRRSLAFLEREAQLSGTIKIARSSLMGQSSHIPQHNNISKLHTRSLFL